MSIQHVGPFNRSLVLKFVYDVINFQEIHIEYFVLNNFEKILCQNS